MLWRRYFIIFILLFLCSCVSKLPCDEIKLRDISVCASIEYQDRIAELCKERKELEEELLLLEREYLDLYNKQVDLLKGVEEQLRLEKDIIRLEEENKLLRFKLAGKDEALLRLDKRIKDYEQKVSK